MNFASTFIHCLAYIETAQIDTFLAENLKKVIAWNETFHSNNSTEWMTKGGSCLSQFEQIFWKYYPTCISFTGESLTSNVTVPSGDAYPGACDTAKPFPFNSGSKLHEIARYRNGIFTCSIKKWKLISNIKELFKCCLRHFTFKCVPFIPNTTSHFACQKYALSVESHCNLLNVSVPSVFQSNINKTPKVVFLRKTQVVIWWCFHHVNLTKTPNMICYSISCFEISDFRHSWFQWFWQSSR